MDNEMNDGLDALKKSIASITKQIKSIEQRINRHEMMLSAPQTISEEEKIKEMLELDLKLLKLYRNDLDVKNWLLK